MYDALSRAFADADRSYFAAKARAPVSPDVLAQGPAGMPQRLTDMGAAAEATRHFSNHVFACVRLIATRLAGTTIHVGRLATDRPASTSRAVKHYIESTLPIGMKAMATRLEPFAVHPLTDALSDPSELDTKWSLVYRSVAGLELTGRAFWWMPMHEGRRRFFYIPTSWVRGWNGASRYESWQVQPPGAAEPFDIPSEEMSYFSLPSPEHATATRSPLQAAAAAVQTDAAIQNAQLDAFHRGVTPQIALRVGRLPGMTGAGDGQRPVLTSDQRKQLINTVLMMHEGVANRHEPLILDGLIEGVDRLSHGNDEMDWLNSSETTRSRIFMAYGCSEVLLGHTANANRATSIVAEQIFCDNVCNPLAQMFSEVLTAWLAPLFANGSERLVVWLAPCVPNDVEVSLRKIDTLARHRLASVDELRALAGLPPSESDMLLGDMPPRAGDAIANAIGDAVSNQFAQIGVQSLFDERRGMNGHPALS